MGGGPLFPRPRSGQASGNVTSPRALAALAAAGALATAGAAAQPPPDGFPAGPSVEFRLVADGLVVPVHLAEPDDGTGRRFVVDQAGQIRVLLGDDRLLEEPFLDLSDRIVDLDPNYDERGALGIAFHPDYRENGRFFVYYSAPLREDAPEDWDHTSHLSEFRVSEDDPNVADPRSERIVLEVDQPFGNHNAGHITFGPDGYLYVPLGDGGNGGDIDPDDDDRGRPPEGNAQTPGTLLGSILRIDVDGDEPYGIPEDNPFVGEDEFAPETWAYGFRNPYGLSFDLETAELYAADAGQALYEEASIVEPGGNHGWNIREGTHCFDPDDFLEAPDDCPDEGARGEPLVDPVVEYQRGPETGSVIVSGVRYRGELAPELENRFVFGEYARIRFEPDGVVYAATPGDGLWEIERVTVANTLDGRSDGELHRFVLAVVQDIDGELYALTTREGGPTGRTGEVFALVSPDAPADVASDRWWPWALGAVGLGLLALVVLGALAWRRREGET